MHSRGRCALCSGALEEILPVEILTENLDKVGVLVGFGHAGLPR